MGTQPPYGYDPQNPQTPQNPQWQGQPSSYPPGYGQDPSYPGQPAGYPPQPGQYPQPGGYAQPYPAPAAPQQGGGLAIAALVLGIISLIAWLLPICGFPVAIVGLILGFIGRRSPARRGMATAGIVLNIIGLVLTIGSAAFGVYIATQGGSLGLPTVTP